MNKTQRNRDKIIELEDQFLLRLPINDADYLRQLLHSKPRKVKKHFKLILDVDDRIGGVLLENRKIDGKLRKFPTIIESYKIITDNNKQLAYKTADICQLLDCTVDKIVDNGGKTVNDEMVHGLTPPLKNVKKQRFRKCLFNKDEQSIDLQKELVYLLQADLDAVNSKFEIIEDKSTKSQQNNEIEIFGEILSDSEIISDYN